MTDYSENVFDLNDNCFVFKRSAVSGNHKFREINLFYKYLTQKHKILVNKGKILKKLHKLRKR